MSLRRRAGEASPPVDLGLPREFNLASWLLDRALEQGGGDRIALICGEESYTWARLAEEVDRAGNLLLALGVQVEQRVALLMADSPAFVAVFLGAVKIGAVPVPFGGMLRSHEYRYLLQDSRARVAVLDLRFLPAIEGVLGDSPWLEHVLISGHFSDRYPNLQDGLQDSSPDLEAAPTTVDDVAFWLYSSGATGFPKAAVHLHHDAVFSCHTFAAEILGVQHTDGILSVPRMSTAYGLGNSLFFPLYSGARAVLLPPDPGPEAVLSALSEHRPTLLFNSPSGYAALLQAAQAGASADLSSLRLCLSSGEPLSATLAGAWKQRFGLELLNGLGSTEALHVFLSCRPGEVRPKSVGRPVPGYEVRLETDEGEEVAPSEIGNLLVRGDSTAPRYWNQHRKSARAMQGSWLLTGDMCTVDEDGYFYHVGRSDDMARICGVWVSPTEIEGRLLAQPGVQQAAVVFTEDEQGLARIRAFVVPPASLEPTEGQAEKLRATVNRDQLFPSQVRWLEFVPELPRTASGKLQRYRLRDGT